MIIGTIGSIMVTLGSYAVAGSPTAPALRYDIIRAIRFEAAWVITGIILLALGAMIMCVNGCESTRKWATGTNPTPCGG